MPQLISLAKIQSTIQGTQFADPRLYDVLMAIVARLQAQDIDIQTIQNQIDQTVESVSLDVDPVTVFEYTLQLDFIQLTWERPNSSIFNFEIRKGSNWDTAVRVLITNTTSAVINPLTVGTHTYLIKSIDVNGIYSSIAKELNIIISPIGSISISHNVIDNNVLLYWDAPSSAFRILYYIVKRNGTEIGNKDGTFTTVFEQAAGTNTYGIIAVDIAGNQSAEGLREVIVTQPPDYVLEDIQEDDFSGTKVNALAENNYLLCCVDTTESWTNHFVNNSWGTIQDQINAGFDIYIEPSKTSGSYVQVFDFSSIFTNIIINVNWSSEVLDDSVSVVCKIRVSDDDITYTSYVSGTSLYVVSARYVDVKLEFTGGTNKLIKISDLFVRLDIKETTDSGTIAALAADASGTTVTFNKSFKDIRSIVVSVNTTTEKKAIYDFTDVPNPTSFKVLVYNAAGSRVDATVSWLCKGII